MVRCLTKSASPAEVGNATVGFAAWVIPLIAVMFFACPLLFFTNLTANPCFTQIALLYVLLSVSGLFWAASVLMSGKWRIPVLGVEKPLLLFLFFALVSSILSWMRHPDLHESIILFSVQGWLFLLLNGIVVLYLPSLFLKPLSAETTSSSIWPDLGFAAGWGLLWVALSASEILDWTAVVLWAAGLVYALFRIKKGDAGSFFHLLFIVAVLAGGYGIIQYTGYHIFWGEREMPWGGRAVSTFGNPNFLSSFLLLVCPLAVAFGLSSKRANAFGYGLVALIAGVSILCTLTRSSLLGLFASFIFLGFVLFRQSYRSVLWKAALAGGAILLMLYFFPGAPASRGQSPLAHVAKVVDALSGKASHGPLSQRMLVWSSAWDMVKDHPLLGTGLGCFELFYPFYQSEHLFNPVLAPWRTHANNAHNLVLELWTQLGTVGVACALLFLAGFVRKAFHIMREQVDQSQKILRGGLLAGCLGMLVENFFGNVSLFVAIPAFFFWWNLGVLCNESLRIGEFRRSSRNITSFLLLFMIIGVFLFSGIYYVTRWNQERYAFKGVKSAHLGHLEEAIKDLQTAKAWFPWNFETNYHLGNSYAAYGKELFDSGRSSEGLIFKNKAIRTYNDAMKIDPGYFEVYYNAALTAFEIGDKVAGFQNLKKALALNPLLHSAYGPLADHYAELKQWIDARELLEKAVKAFPDDKDFWNNLAYVYEQLGEKEKSLEAQHMSVKER